jgi:four helix bundle protein
MSTIARFEEIRAWQTARTLTREVYTVSNEGAFARDYGLRDQLRRSAVSILSNIAEGFESDTQQQFVKYLGYAKASAGEVRAQLYVALDVGYLDRAQFEHVFDLAEKCSRQLSRFITYLKSHRGQQIHEIGDAYVIKTSER